MKKRETKYESIEPGCPIPDSYRCCATPGALEALEKAGIYPVWLFARHFHGDWGDLCEADKRANDEALKDGGRLFSAYHLPSGVKVWAITEADRSMTTLLLPSDY